MLCNGHHAFEHGLLSGDCLQAASGSCPGLMCLSLHSICVFVYSHQLWVEVLALLSVLWILIIWQGTM